MKLFFSLFALIAIVLAVYPFVFPDDDSPARVEGLPWQIQLQADGNTSVFGLTPGVSTLAEAVSTLGQDNELAIIAANDEAGELEMYFGHYRAGLISGKMVLQAAVTADRLERWKNEAVKVDYMPSGQARKYLLDSASLPEILQSTITNITFIPAVNLDEEVIVARFGKAEKTVRVNEKLVHFLYPSKGLDIALSDGQKDVLQYVAPSEFDRLAKPLQ